MLVGNLQLRYENHVWMACPLLEDLSADVNVPLLDCTNLQRVYCVLENLCSVAAILVEQLQAAGVTVK